MKPTPMSNENAKATAAVTDSIIGAGLGAIIGNQTKAGSKKGAAIGAGLGLLHGWGSGVERLGGDGSIAKTRRGE